MKKKEVEKVKLVHQEKNEVKNYILLQNKGIYYTAITPRISKS
jgi:hypothetical protein